MDTEDTDVLTGALEAEALFQERRGAIAREAATRLREARDQRKQAWLACLREHEDTELADALGISKERVAQVAGRRGQR